ncbi:glycerate kinase [Komagataeibacter saccharivorans]|uniref:glycerate kinase type-2 family protein n=1 Tax=Komagataeibacter saccharivorans TaxID=265959 RepID=UPI000D7C6B9E|nr:glycerate kinase [Komagataeibacter saccharivorans]PYD51565.1 glycerate kinase [Komagataeibacter saccharivorans]GBQ42472.1 glycerate dehydrogenase [Komagataeibacter saccharivorans NRIC 0614]
MNDTTTHPFSAMTQSVQAPGWTDERARAVLRRILDAAIHSAMPDVVLARYLPPRPEGKCVVVGAGKAAASMAAALEQAWPDVDLTGCVVTRDGHTTSTRRIRVLEAAHPVPDSRSEAAARAMLDAVSGLGPDDLVIALISGGGSALMELPRAGVTLDDIRAINRALLHSGASINDMNVVRRHLSVIKGGGLAAAAAPARVVTLAISDVPGDDPLTIASGPTVADPTTPDDALSILVHYGIPIPEAVRTMLAQAAPARAPASGCSYTLISTPLMALEAAAETARECGLAPLILGDALEGESRDAGTFMAGIALCARLHGLPVAGPAVILSGGETTVTINPAGPAPGRGGRNTEFLLAMATALQGQAGIWAIAADSDGIDGTEDAAGATIAPDTLPRARKLGCDPRVYLRAHDSYSLFQQTGDLVMTGPTLTNVNDIRIVLVT